MEAIVKRFGGNVAVNNVTIEVTPGSVLALLGENGAGKSTLIKVLAGVYHGDSGRIIFKGQDIIDAASIRTKTRQPIAFIHQDLGLVEWMTVAENMAFSLGFPKRFGVIDWRKIRQQALAALERIRIDIDPDARVFSLSQTERSLLAIARALAVDADILVLDEPTAALPADDVTHVFATLRELQNQGVGMIYVTHRLDEVMELADEVAILRDGVLIAQGATQQYSLRDLVQMIVGEEKAENKRFPLPRNTQPVLELDHVTVGDTGPVDFCLHAGEMLALAGLRGAGQEDVGRLLFGTRYLQAGTIRLNGDTYVPTSPQKAIQSGISLVARDRVGESLAMSLSVQENMFLAPMNHGNALLSPYTSRSERQKAEQLSEQLDIRPRRTDVDISALSGGNQQKVVMARWLDIRSPVLVLEDPTAGVDVGARVEIYDILNEILRTGHAIIVISTDFEEITNICNRALVFNRGRVVGELLNDDVTFANLLELSSGSGALAT
ncbi:sugar ABC transporter ATP-binding protein [candidate division KSB3 bacterium]|uniref:Sugar ABC transporter ATP-binding protein n=1 Tax=candidate division KSB3 bacterium TaxID=2044937 RepID=A0A2G6E7L1_9BACT|nr:MAG: sugar ABC transporter ATP-binding protein [candidate division KSB3 bacterium]PIE30497.1 MAG: sugar ABC transporter ATP-binding protein [candidate division KSB3 bacterium]